MVGKQWRWWHNVSYLSLCCSHVIQLLPTLVKLVAFCQGCTAGCPLRHLSVQSFTTSFAAEIKVHYFFWHDATHGSVKAKVLQGFHLVKQEAALLGLHLTKNKSDWPIWRTCLWAATACGSWPLQGQTHCTPMGQLNPLMQPSPSRSPRRSRDPAWPTFWNMMASCCLAIHLFYHHASRSAVWAIFFALSGDPRLSSLFHSSVCSAPRAPRAPSLTILFPS